MQLIGAKMDYALRALADLALAGPGATNQIRDIAARQGLREAYLDQIMLALRRAGIVRSSRGAGGGHALARPPAAITMWQIALAVGAASAEDGYVAVGPPTSAAEAVRQLAVDTHAKLEQWLGAITLADLADTAAQNRDALSIAVGM